MVIVNSLLSWVDSVISPQRAFTPIIVNCITQIITLRNKGVMA